MVTEPSSKTSRIARAISGAIDSWVILSRFLPLGSGSVLVTTTSLILLLLSRSLAGSAKSTIVPVKPDKQHIKIVWRVRRADGAEIGTVGQENDIPKGLLDGAWGDVAYSVAIAGADGLMQVIARAGAEGKS